MGALEYEYLLRRIYQVGRYGKKGADADIYRTMEHAKALTNDANSRLRNKTIEDLEYDYRVECRKVWRFVEEAIKKSIDKYSHILSEEEVRELEKLTKESSDITKEIIDERIKVAQDIFVKHKIFPA